MTDSKRMDGLREPLLNWYSKNRRDLPWRTTYDPYATWIAEVMMQQTQMERGVSYFLRWMKQFPTIRSVADAPDDALLKAWEGLGYSSRARNIKAAAQLMLERHEGCVPAAQKDLLALPGIGPYTAGAIASTAFNIPVPCVDGNVERVLARIFNVDSPVKAEPAKGRIQRLAAALIPEDRARDFNQALMEFGALLCRKKPSCDLCPLPTGLCAARLAHIERERPVLGRRAEIKPVEVANGLLMSHGRVFVQRREDDGIWANLWEFPGGGIEPGETPAQAVMREWREELDLTVKPVKKLPVIRHAYTTYRITLHAFLLELAPPPVSFPSMPAALPEPPALREATEWRWVTPAELAELPMPGPHRKLAEFV